MNRKARRRRRQQREESKLGALPPGQEGGQYKPLADHDVGRIHDAALTVLERTGVHIEESECRQVLVQNGARVDKRADRVYLSRTMIEAALNTVDRNVVLYSRDGRNDLHLRGKRVHLGTGGAAVIVVDLDTGQTRHSRLRDLYDIGRLVDTLDNIHFYLRPVVARDVQNDDIDINTFYACLAATNNTFYACLAATNKHVMGGCYFPEKIAEIKRLAVLIAGSEEAFLARPFISFNLCWMVSPLRFATETTETLTAAVRAGVPVSLVSAPQSGATSPASLVGTLVQVIAEELAGLTYVQLLRPGHPTLMGGMPLVSDLRTGNMIGGAAELALMNAASAQMTHFYGVPVYSSSALTDSKIPDVQAGFEKGLTTAAAFGRDVGVDAGRSI
jgi:trimethylamine--corrinoid protein Co-methyltransferase